MIMTTKKIGIDVDGVLCDFISYCITLNNATFPHNHKTYSDITEFDLTKSFGKAEWLVVNELFRETRACLKLPLYPGAINLYNGLKALGEVYFVTSPLYSYPGWCEERVGWLKQNLGADKTQVVFASNKNIANVDLLIDDAAHNLKKWEDTGKPGIKVNRPWNAHYRAEYEASNEDEVLSHVSRILG